MGPLFGQLANHWQFRFVSILACLALVTYAVVMPVHSSELLTASDFGTTPSTAGSSSAASVAVPTVARPTNGGIVTKDGAVNKGVDSASWVAMNHAAANRLEEVVLLYGDNKVPRDASEAIRGLGYLARQGNVTAEYLFGEAYQKGLGLRKDVLESARWYEKASRDRKVLASADAFAAPGNFEEAFANYRSAAEAGQMPAQLYLALAYDFGIEVSPDFAEAAHWYRKAAAQGSVSATCNLGLMYLAGDGLAKDDQEADLWLSRAASRGSLNAQVALGRMYYTGDGVAKSDSTAAMWLEKAANQGNSQAQLRLSWFYETGLGVQGSSAKAYMWINLASSSDPQLGEARDQVGALISETELRHGQKLTHDWLVQRSSRDRSQILE